ncbi:MAG: hypothetical protein PHX83_09810 [Acidobacteriia bacterium]|nr:hypothetical protein [Terriglobia bacterium]
MNTKRLLAVARRIESLERQLINLKGEAQKLVGGSAGSAGFKTKTMSPAARKKIAEAMRRRWAAVKRG